MKAPVAPQSDPNGVIPQKATYSSLHWNTSGGGNLQFDISLNASGNALTISNVSSEGTPYTKPDTLSQNDSSSLYTGLLKVLDGTDTSWSYTSGYGGSWTSIILTPPTGKPATYSNVNTFSDTALNDLYQFVHNHLSNEQTSTSYVKIHWDTTGGGDLHFDVTPGTQAGAFLVSNIISQGVSYSTQMGINYPFGPSQEVATLFNGTHSIQSGASTGYTGSWTTIILTSSTGQTVQYTNVGVVTDSVLNDLYHYIKNNTPGGL